MCIAVSCREPFTRQPPEIQVNVWSESELKKNISIYSLIKAVAILYEVIQFLSGIFNDIFVELNSMVYTKRP